MAAHAQKISAPAQPSHQAKMKNKMELEQNPAARHNIVLRRSHVNTNTQPPNLVNEIRRELQICGSMMPFRRI
jgi:hypothetical protein